MNDQTSGPYRITIEMHLKDPLENLDEDGTALSPVDSYFQTFGVTASGYSEAAGYAEEALGESIAENPEASGWLVEMKITAFDSDDIEDDLPLKQPVSQPGVHFVSGRILYSSEEPGDEE